MAQATFNVLDDYVTLALNRDASLVERPARKAQRVNAALAELGETPRE